MQTELQLLHPYRVCIAYWQDGMWIELEVEEGTDVSALEDDLRDVGWTRTKFEAPPLHPLPEKLLSTLREMQIIGMDDTKYEKCIEEIRYVPPTGSELFGGLNSTERRRYADLARPVLMKHTGLKRIPRWFKTAGDME